MDANFTDKLIQEIKKKPVIYSQSHPDYRNDGKKLQAWCEIGEELDEEVHILKSKWKNLRDSYKKYKQAKGSFASKKLYWECMSFTDPSDDQGIADDDSSEPTSNATDSKGERRVEKKLDSADGEAKARKKRRQDGEDIETTEVRMKSRQDGADNDFREEAIKKSREYSETTDDERKTRHTLDVTENGHLQNKKKNEEDEERVDETTDDERKTRHTLDVTENSHLQTKKRNEEDEERVDVNFDEIDLLFLGYADRLKKLPRRAQISLKFELAKLFMEAELNDLNTLGLTPPESVEDSVASDDWDPLDPLVDIKMDIIP